ncbi:efflux RND transporter periplasmic adaptor subunit [Brevibacillus humidisoli]|uniref:efflux RND transporter periplasmic adaptor subunit n=1 Tax=Brevibacillus humidisoli TaxID=2895522 RepID=UPI001E37B38F|nr:efflux RND transporter periplasmic adaptor subunit [Brevibacillus humidisoli]UFJ39787.1 efflux RND transporter periplasmic adaptor subunit [Brevibacillus humidisoli]
MGRWMFSLIAVLVLVGGCEELEEGVDRLREAEERDRELAEHIKPVHAYTVGEHAEIKQEIYGIVTPRQELALSFGTSGTIDHILVEKGSHVQKGSLLATLDTAVWQQELAAAQNEVRLAQVEREEMLQGDDSEAVRLQKLQLERAEEQAKRAVQAYEQAQQLYDNGAIAREELDRRAWEKKNAELTLQEEQITYEELLNETDSSEVVAAQVRVEQATAELRRAQQDVRQAELRAPFAGVVADIYRTASEQISSSQEVIRLIDPAEWIVQLQVDSGQIGQWQVGKRVTVASGDGQETEGIVRFVSPAMNHAGSYSVEVRIENANDLFKAGMSVACRYVLETDNGFFVPASSVGFADEAYYVMKIANGASVSKQPVQVGTLHGEWYQIVDGLNAGEQVVESGITYVRDGDAVQVANQDEN